MGLEVTIQSGGRFSSTGLIFHPKSPGGTVHLCHDPEMTSAVELRYDPYDVAINADPYPYWKRLRDDAPLYFNQEHGFYALSRYQDISPALVDWNTFSSSARRHPRDNPGRHRIPARYCPFRRPAHSRHSPRPAFAACSPRGA